MLAAHNPVAPSGPWSLGVLIGTPITILLLIVCVVAFWFSFRYWRSELLADETRDRFTTSDTRLAFGLMVGSVAAALVVAVAYIGFMWPFNSQFHQWRSVQGTVQQVSSRIVSSDKTVSQRYVVVIDGQAFGIDDTRASLLHKGDKVSLHCKREFQFQANSGWGCRWN